MDILKKSQQSHIPKGLRKIENIKERNLDRSLRIRLPGGIQAEDDKNVILKREGRGS